jgi:hypothetical protein
MHERLAIVLTVRWNSHLVFLWGHFLLLVFGFVSKSSGTPLVLPLADLAPQQVAVSKLEA